MSRAASAIDVRPRPPAAIGSTTAGRLSVDVHRDLDLRPEDVRACASLLESRPSVAVFLSPAWLSGYFAEPPDGSDLSLLLLRDHMAVRGLAAVAVRAEFGCVRVRLLGGGTGSDRTDLVAARGYEAACSDALLSWMAETFGKGFVFELRDVPAESPLWGAVHRANAEGSHPLTIQPREVHTLPFLDLAEARRPAAAQGGGSLRLPSLDKHRRWLERRGRLEIERVEEEDDLARALASLRDFLHTRWSHAEGGSALDQPRLVRFHEHVLPRLRREGRLRMLRLSVDARTVAVFYGLASGTWWGYCLAGYDREWAGRIHLGRLTLATAIDLAAQEGATEFDFLKGAHAVKYLWPVRERATLDAEVYSAQRAPQLARAAWAGREAGAALAKSVRGGPSH